MTEKLRKISAIALLNKSLWDVIKNFKAAIKIAAFVIIINSLVAILFSEKNAERTINAENQIPVSVATNLDNDKYTNILNKLGADNKKEKSLPNIVGFTLIIFNLITYLSMAVCWHRLIIFGEMPKNLTHIPPAKNSFKYALSGLVIFAISFAAIILTVGLGALLASFVAPLIFVLAPFGVFILVYLIGYGFRMSLKLPAIALGIEGITINNSLILTKGNTLKLGWAAFLSGIVSSVISLILMMPVIILGFLISDSHPDIQQLTGVLSVIFLYSMNSLNLFFGISILTNLYKFFVKNEELR